jgi:hypothetical protein
MTREEYLVHEKQLAWEQVKQQLIMMLTLDEERDSMRHLIPGGGLFRLYDEQQAIETFIHTMEEKGLIR